MLFHTSWSRGHSQTTLTSQMGEAGLAICQYINLLHKLRGRVQTMWTEFWGNFDLQLPYVDFFTKYIND